MLPKNSFKSFLNLHNLFLFLKQEGASDEDIRQLPKYKFRKICEKLTGETCGPSGGIMTECGTDTPIEHVLSAEDAVSQPDLISLFCHHFPIIF